MLERHELMDWPILEDLEEWFEGMLRERPYWLEPGHDDRDFPTKTKGEWITEGLVGRTGGGRINKYPSDILGGLHPICYIDANVPTGVLQKRRKSARQDTVDFRTALRIIRDHSRNNHVTRLYILLVNHWDAEAWHEWSDSHQALLQEGALLAVYFVAGDRVTRLRLPRPTMP